MKKYRNRVPVASAPPQDTKLDETIFDDASDEAAAEKLWAVYVSEAEKYDKALVESWRANMEGMLIFAGLFSASLTAFLIESYKTLNADSGDATVRLLTQISQQLAATANGTTFTTMEPPPFAPATASLVCNAFWFISLGLSLACALTATLLEQWARDFLHRADMRSAPLIRARIFSYLYYGLRRFNMHTVVEVIPLLLHASLVLFFAGLVAFLLPVNHMIMTIVAVLMVLIVAVYAALTVLPLIHFDCPYRTPLSGGFWRAFQYLNKSFKRGSSEATLASGEEMNLVEAMNHHATIPSLERKARDCKALVWTVKSLTDEAELESFIDAIPDLLWRTAEYIGTVSRPSYQDHIQGLIGDPDVRFAARLMELIWSCDNGLLPSEIGKRRKISAYRAIWAISSLSILPKCLSSKPGPFNGIDAKLVFEEGDPHIEHFATSARAVMACSIYHGDRTGDAILDYLHTCQAAGNDQIQTMGMDRINRYIRRLPNASTRRPLDTFGKVLEAVQTYRDHELLRILFDYLCSAASLLSAPYLLESTITMICPNRAQRLDSVSEAHFKYTVHSIIQRLNKLAPDGIDAHWIDSILLKLLIIGRDICYPSSAVIDVFWCAGVAYLMGRNSPSAVSRLFWEIETVIWAAIPQILSTAGPTILQVPQEYNAWEVFWEGPLPMDAVLSALWRILCRVDVMIQEHAVYSAALEAVVQTPPSPVRTSVMALLKFRILPSGVFDYSKVPAMTPLPMTSQAESAERDHSAEVAWEAHISLTAEFLEACHTTEQPYKAGETLRKISGCLCELGCGKVHRHHQERFANAITALYKDGGGNEELMQGVVCSELFEPYVDDSGKSTPWLDNAESRHEIARVFAGYRNTLSEKPLVAARVDEILKGLSLRHPPDGASQSSVQEL